MLICLVSPAAAAAAAANFVLIHEYTLFCISKAKMRSLNHQALVL